MAEDQKVELMIPATIDSRDFLRFALFDTFRMKKRWKTPLLFACIISAFSAVCFAARKTHEQAVLLGTVLLTVGLALPLVWFLLYVSSVKTESKKHRLSKAKAQYCSYLGREELKVVRDQEEAVFVWKDIYTACRVSDCIYLYVSPARAYLLPDCENSDAAWDLITSRIPEEKIRDFRQKIRH